MNIFILNDHASIVGGASQVAIASAHGLADAGYKVTFVFCVGPVHSQLNHPNIDLVNLEQFDLLSNPSIVNATMVGLWNIDVEQKIGKLLDGCDFKNTIIHVHSWVKSLSASAISVFISKGFRVVLTLHDYFTICPNGGFYNYQAQRICKLNPMSLSCLATNCDSRSYSQKIWRYLRQLFQFKAGIPGKLKHFISVSKFSEDILRPWLPKNTYFWSIPNPIDVKKNNNANPANYHQFSFVGRLSYEKGVDLFARAREHVDISVRFVGSGDLLNSLKKNNLDAEFTGWVSRKKVFEYIKTSRAVVFPSHWYETQGMVALEAAAHGTPVIVSDSCAAKNYIIDGVTGMHFKSGNADSLAGKIEILSSKPSLSVQMGQEAYEHYWADPFSINKHVMKLLECYKDILKAG